MPKEVREALGIKPGAKLLWTIRNSSVLVSAMPEDRIKAMRGALKDLPFSTADLLGERRADRHGEEERIEETLRRWRSTR